MNGNKEYNHFNIGSSRENGATPEEFLLFQQKKAMSFMFKMFLNELESMKDENLISEDYFKKQRKLILDTGNNFLREFEEQLDKFEIRFKRNYNY